MNKNVLIVLAGGFVVAILVAVLVQASLGGKKKTTSDTAPKTQVLVAAKDLAVGKTLAEGDLKWQTWPVGTAFVGAIVREGEQKADDALKGRLIQKVNAGQPVLNSYIFKEGRGNVVAATLEKGMRAVAIPVKADTMAGGFVIPGDRVDVIMTYKVSAGRGDETAQTEAFVRSQASETILENIRVLAVDQETTRENENAKVARTVTLAVSREAAEKLSLASEMGSLTLALRALGDDEAHSDSAVTTDVTVSRTIQNLNKIKEEEASAKPIRIYNGANIREIQPRSALTGQTTATPSDAVEEEAVQ